MRQICGPPHFQSPSRVATNQNQNPRYPIYARVARRFPPCRGGRGWRGGQATGVGVVIVHRSPQQFRAGALLLQVAWLVEGVGSSSLHLHGSRRRPDRPSLLAAPSLSPCAGAVIGRMFLILRNGEHPMPDTAAVSYLRTSSATNVGGDSDVRQRLAIAAFADAQGFAVVREFYDAAVKGGDPIDVRPGFASLLQWCDENAVRTILVENASRFSRDLIVQETGHAMLKARGIKLIAADDPDAFTSDTPTATLIRQILGAVAQFEKAALVAKLRGARERKRAATGRCEGNLKGYDRTRPELVAAAHALRGAPLRTIAGTLAIQGFTTSTGRPFSAAQVARLLRYEPASELAAIRLDTAALDC